MGASELLDLLKMLDLNWFQLTFNGGHTTTFLAYTAILVIVFFAAGFLIHKLVIMVMNDRGKAERCLIESLIAALKDNNVEDVCGICRETTVRGVAGRIADFERNVKSELDRLHRELSKTEFERNAAIAEKEEAERISSTSELTLARERQRAADEERQRVSAFRGMPYAAKFLISSMVKTGELRTDLNADSALIAQLDPMIVSMMERETVSPNEILYKLTPEAMDFLCAHPDLLENSNRHYHESFGSSLTNHKDDPIS